MKLLILLFLTFISGLTFAITPEEILQKSDDIKNPRESFFMNVSVHDLKDDKISTFDVYTKGKERTLIKTTSPKKDIGRNLLMIEDNMWAYIPNLKRSVRISISQKLTGQAANGDIARMRWAEDYDVKLEKEDKDNFYLFLTAKEEKKNLTYSKIKITIAKKDFHPLEATYLTNTEKVLKKSLYKNYQVMAGGTRPSQIEIENALDSSDKSIITLSNMKIEPLPDHFFDKDQMQ